eukprot:gene6799-7015_t
MAARHVHMYAYHAVTQQDLYRIEGCLHKVLRELLAHEPLVMSPAKPADWRQMFQAAGLGPLALLLHYSVATGNKSLTHRLLDEGASPDAASLAGNPPHLHLSLVPPLAVAVIKHDSRMVHLLLSRGASPRAIPPEFFVPAVKKLGMQRLGPACCSDPCASAWCASLATASHVAEWMTSAKQALKEALDPALDCGLTMCYWLARASELPSLTPMAYKVMRESALIRAPEMRLAVIGQEIACSLLYNQMLAYFGLSDTPLEGARKPLVLLLAGPPGHGKTLMGQSMPRMLGDIPYHFEDCSKLDHVIDLLGATGKKILAGQA